MWGLAKLVHGVGVGTEGEELDMEEHMLRLALEEMCNIGLTGGLELWGMSWIPWGPIPDSSKPPCDVCALLTFL